MDQNLFNSIQNNFRNFLSKKNSHSQTKPLVTEQITDEQLPIELIEMEKTYGFGSGDCEIGYKMMVTDKHGKKSYKIFPPQ